MEGKGDRANFDDPSKFRFHVYGYKFPICKNNFSLCTMYKKLMKLNFAMFLVLSLSSWWQQALGKSYGLCAKMEYWSVTPLPLGKPRAVNNIFYQCREVGDLSAFVTEWQGANRDW